MLAGCVTAAPEFRGCGVLRCSAVVEHWTAPDCGVLLGPLSSADGCSGMPNGRFSTDVADDVRVVRSCVRPEATRRSCMTHMIHLHMRDPCCDIVWPFANSVAITIMRLQGNMAKQDSESRQQPGAAHTTMRQGNGISTAWG